jgi:signal transduction histidine kinase
MNPLTTAIAPTEPSRHKCLIYDGDPSEQLPVVIPFLSAGLRNNWRCFYVGSPVMVQMVDSALTAHGVDTAGEVQLRSLILSSDQSHLVDGKFEPQKMVDMLCGLVDEAVEDGLEGLCATGDMLWELGETKNFERLLEYEALLEEVFRCKPLRGICQYHRNMVPAQAVRNALIAHRSVYIGEQLNSDNFFYIPPELLLERHNGSTASKQGEWMCQQITRVLEAEHKRDKALAALRASEAHQRQLSEELAEMNRHLERRVMERTAELETANKYLESFSYSVSHDLRAPLRSIVGFSEMLAEECGEALGESGRKHLNRVLANSQRMQELIDGLLTLSGVVRADLLRVPVDLSRLAEEVVQEIRESAPERPAEVVIQKGLETVGDRTLLRAVLTNLVGNAWKFTSKVANPCIEIGQKNSDTGQSTFFVKDNGVGFEMKYAQRLFGVFQRLHGEQEFPGTGIGLATVQRIIARHGGTIWAESMPGQGATFWFTLAGEPE